MSFNMFVAACIMAGHYIKNPLTILEAPFLKRRIQFKGSIEKTVAMRKALNIKTTRAIYGGIPYSHISP
jgi:hypothetical protein